jgi:hypothetical protein
MNTNSNDSPAIRVMNEAIELAIQERSPYPECAAFINANTPKTAKAIKRAFDEHRAAVLVSADGSTVFCSPSLLAPSSQVTWATVYRRPDTCATSGETFDVVRSPRYAENRRTVVVAGHSGCRRRDSNPRHADYDSCRRV